jgi:peptide/nickel transport system ATP-binding protein
VVESAKTIPIFKESRHPYTWALLQALPRLDDSRKRLQPLRGNPPDMVNLPEQCPFLPRCLKAISRCRFDRRPYLEEMGLDHHVACYNPVLPNP